jgi:hypothetical protein
MVGHLKITPCKLDKLQKETYWLSYCSICHALRKNQGFTTALLLSNELTLLLLAFGNYIPKDDLKTICPATFFLQKKPIFQNETSKLAASLSILLAWLKITDDLTDEPNLSKKLIYKILDRKMQNKVVLSENLQTVVADYILVVKANETDFEKVQLQSKTLASALAIEIGRTTTASPTFIAQQAEIFGLLGELIGIADHLIDLEIDFYQSAYNPIIEIVTNKQITFATAYQIFLDKFYYKRNLILLSLKETTNITFIQATQGAMQTLLTKIYANKPIFVEYEPENETYRHTMQIHKADCDCGGCDCDCGSCDCCAESSCGNDCCSFCSDCGNCDCNVDCNNANKKKKK